MNTKKIGKMKISYLVIFLALIFSCDNQEKMTDGDPKIPNNIAPEELFQKNEHIEGTIIESNANLGDPFWILTMDTLLISMQMGGDNIFNIYDLKNSVNLGDFGTIGRGPGEFLSPFSLEKLSESTIGVYDVNGRIYYQLNIDSLLKFPNYLPNEMFRLKDLSTRCFLVLPFNQNEFISTGSFEEGKYALFSNNKLKSYFLDYPNDGHENIGNAKKAMIYQGRILKHPFKDKFVYLNSSSPIYEIVGKSNNEFKTVLNNIIALPKYKANKNVRPIKERDNKNGFLDGAVGKKFIYMLYSGKSYETSGMDCYTGNKIFIIDWEGNPIKYLVTNEDLVCISIDKEENTLYAIALFPEPKYVRYEL